MENSFEIVVVVVVIVAVSTSAGYMIFMARVNANKNDFQLIYTVVANMNMSCSQRPLHPRHFGIWITTSHLPPSQIIYMNTFEPKEVNESFRHQRHLFPCSIVPIFIKTPWMYAIVSSIWQYVPFGKTFPIVHFVPFQTQFHRRLINYQIFYDFLFPFFCCCCFCSTYNSINLTACRPNQPTN